VACTDSLGGLRQVECLSGPMRVIQVVEIDNRHDVTGKSYEVGDTGFGCCGW